jgi:3-oxoacyl-[acyl-carrier-protein] synthase II
MSHQDGRRVVITGMGVVAPNGHNKAEFWNGLMAGRSMVRRITRFDPQPYASQVGGEVPNFRPHPKIPSDHLQSMDRAYQMGLTAAFEAIEDSGLHFEGEDPTRAGVYLGVAVAGIDSTEKEFHTIIDRGIQGLPSNLYRQWLPSSCSGYVSLAFGLEGPSHVYSTGCTSSADAMGSALDYIRSGEGDIAITGGAEAPLMPLVLNSFCAMRALSTRNDDPSRASRPFDKERDGFVLGEGAAVLVLESLEHARRRGARIYAEFAGVATTTNAFHMTAPEPTGQQASRAFELALADAELLKDSVDYICVHGSSTPLNERAETAAIKRVFGARAYNIPISSIKSMIGHSLGSAGALQAVACSLALGEGSIPPTINYEVPDPDCDLDIVPNVARRYSTRVILSNSAGFSGKNTVMVFRAL